MNKKNFIKLARLVAKFAEVSTDKGTLIYNDELAIGAELVTEEGEPVEDGEYLLEDGRKLVVAESKIADIVEPAVEEAPEVEAVEAEEVDPSPMDPTDDKEAEYIAELEAKIAEYESTIAALEAKVKELEDKAEAPVEEAVALSAVPQPRMIKTSGAMKYFE